MDNIILTGMPSCGKSTLGRMLAKDLGYDFIDTDDVIIQRNGCPLKDILDNEGLDGFIRREEEAVCSVNVTHAVIATGGSVVYSPKAMEHLKSLGRVVYLCLDFKEIERRLGDLHERGVAIAPCGICLTSALRCTTNMRIWLSPSKTATPPANR